jgi:SAM-dependent methyltransferase
VKARQTHGMNNAESASATTTGRAVAPESETASVRQLYASAVEYTWQRTLRIARIERAVLTSVLATCLPPGAEVGDIGGGNGAVAFDLADRGHSVRLVDLTPELVSDAVTRNKFARNPLRSVEVADARALPWPDESLQACLMLGPLLHLRIAADRNRALSEAYRVLRPGGVLVVQTFTLMGGLRYLLTRYPHSPRSADVEVYRTSGCYPADHPSPLLSCSVFLPRALAAAEIAESGFTVTDIVGMDGPAPQMQFRLEDATQQTVQAWADLWLTFARQPEYQAACDHMLYVAERPSKLAGAGE